MATFNYKGIEVTVINNGGKEAVDFIHTDTPEPIKFLSGNRIEFKLGGGKYIYQVTGFSLDYISTKNTVEAQKIFINPLEDGNNIVIINKNVDYSVTPMQFYAMEQLESLPDSTIIKTLFMHFLNGMLSRIPELGGNETGCGVEFFNNDGTTSEPLYTYSRNSDIITILPITDSVNWKLIVDGEECLKNETVEITTTETDAETGEEVSITTHENQLVKSLTSNSLESGFHQFTYQILNTEGVVINEQTRNILI
jgi:hypothetical protein